MTGDTVGEVRIKWGQPLDETSVGYVRFDEDYVNVIHITYDLGAGKFLRVLEFHNGRLFKGSNGPRS